MGVNWEELIVAAGDTVKLIRPLLISPRSKMIISGSSCWLIFWQDDSLNSLLVSRKLGVARLVVSRYGLKPTKIFRHIVLALWEKVGGQTTCVAAVESIMTPPPGHSSAGCMMAEEEVAQTFPLSKWNKSAFFF